MRRAVLTSFVLLLMGLAPAPDVSPARAVEGGEPLVVLWVVDGLEPSTVSAATMPTLASLVDGTFGDASTHTWRNTRGVMISETYPNHAAMMTGVDGTVNGIPGNTIWDGSRFRDLGPEDLTAETLFDAVEQDRPEIHTAIAVGDPSIDELFSAEPYDSRWDPRRAQLTLPIAGYPLDEEVVSAALAQISSGADLVFMNTQMVDTFGHFSGPTGSLTRLAIREADRQIGRMIEALRNSGLWARTFLFVVSDHGMETTPDKFLLPLALLLQGDTGWQVDAHGGTALLAKPGATPEESAAVAERLLRWRSVAEALPTGGPLEAAHPDWKLDDQRAGHIVVTAKPRMHLVGFDILDWLATGTHGSPTARDHWLMLTGGSPSITPGDDTSHLAGNVDLAPTIAWILGVPAPAASEGRVLSEAVSP